MITAAYEDLFGENLLSSENIRGFSWIFQPNNASIHIVNSTCMYIIDLGVQVKNWMTVFMI